MPPPLTHWPRPHFRRGGGDPFLFYVVYGSLPSDPTISRGKYRCDGIPDGIDLIAYGPSSNPEAVDSFRHGYLWEEFNRKTPDLAAAVKRQTGCLVIRGSITDPSDLNYFRDVVGLVTWLLDSGGVALYDPQMFKWWEPSDWRTEVFDSATASPGHHVTILVSEDDGQTEWFHTRGMRKFGRPDLSVRRVSQEFRDTIIDLCNRFIEYQALGGVIAEGEEIRMRSVPAGMICSHQGDFDDPDFNNVHVEILWPK